MKICGIICEYNPLHNGHIKHIQYARATSQCDYLVCVMSGNFVQRGEPAILDKFTRAKHAVMAGADIVLELPYCKTVIGADDFASGGISILKAFGANALSFGCETADLSLLTQTADSLLSPLPFQKSALNKLLAEGFSYPMAVAQALGENGKLLSLPNNTLAVTYIKEAKRQNYTPELYPLQRLGSYNDTKISINNPSSLSIRTALNTENLNSEAILATLPPFVVADLSASALNNSKYTDFLFSFVQTLSADTLSKICGVNEGLENRILKYALCGDYDTFIQKVKTKRYTLLRIKRALANAVIGYTAELSQKAKTISPYSRILAVKKQSLKFLMNQYAQSGLNLPLDTPKRKSNDPRNELALLDVKATNLYFSLCKKQGGQDYTHPLPVID